MIGMKNHSVGTEISRNFELKKIKGQFLSPLNTLSMNKKESIFANMSVQNEKVRNIIQILGFDKRKE